MIRTSTLFALVGSLLAAPALSADDKKGPVVEIGGMKSAPPADWKEEAPANTMRVYQFQLPKAEGDAKDAELAIFFFRGGSGTVEQNLQRQTAKFEAAKGKDKVEQTVNKEFKVGKVPATYQDVQGTFLSKFPPFDPNAKITRMENYRQLYVVFETKDGQYYMTLLGPTKTVEKHKKNFEEWLKNFE